MTSMSDTRLWQYLGSNGRPSSAVTWLTDEKALDLLTAGIRNPTAQRHRCAGQATGGTEMTEVVTSNEYSDSWACLCGNDVMSDGFYPCAPDTGEEVDPSNDGPWDGKSMVCAACGRIMDQTTLRPNPNATDEYDSHLVSVVGQRV